jgi:hypothetical protein
MCVTHALSILFALTLYLFSNINISISNSYLFFPGFFTILCYHTIYAMPWIFHSLAFYGADFLVRFLRWRVKGREGGVSLVSDST